MVENNTQAIMYVRCHCMRWDLSEGKEVIILRDTAVAGSCVTLVTNPTLAIQRLDSVLLRDVRIELSSVSQPIFKCLPLGDLLP